MLDTVWLRMPGDIIFTIEALGMVAFTFRAIAAVLCQHTQASIGKRQ